MCCKRIPAGGEESGVVAWRPSGTAAVHAPPLGRTGSGGGEDISQEIDDRVKAAHQRGFSEGETAAAQRAAQRVEPVIAALNNVIQELASTRKRFRAEAEGDTVKLAIAIARRVLHREVATDSEAILGLVIAAFQKLNARETHRLRVSPADAAVIQENRTRLQLPLAVEITADHSLPSGSVIFETSRGEMDASVDTQLGEIERGFADIVQRRLR